MSKTHARVISLPLISSWHSFLFFFFRFFFWSFFFVVVFVGFETTTLTKKLSKGPAFEELFREEKFNVAVSSESDIGVGVVLRTIRRVADVECARYFVLARFFFVS